jgi:hypothetical protein
MMRKSKSLALLCGSIPVVMLVFALPWVNRVTPVILGLPFLLFWIVLWIVLAPPCLLAAYWLDQRATARPQAGER